MKKFTYILITTFLIGIAYNASASSVDDVNETEALELDVRWGAESIYEDKKNYDPFFSDSRVIMEIKEVPETTRQFQIRF